VKESGPLGKPALWSLWSRRLALGSSGAAGLRAQPLHLHPQRLADVASLRQGSTRKASRLSAWPPDLATTSVGRDIFDHPATDPVSSIAGSPADWHTASVTDLTCYSTAFLLGSQLLRRARRTCDARTRSDGRGRFRRSSRWHHGSSDNRACGRCSRSTLRPWTRRGFGPGHWNHPTPCHSRFVEWCERVEKCWPSSASNADRSTPYHSKWRGECDGREKCWSRDASNADGQVWLRRLVTCAWREWVSICTDNYILDGGIDRFTRRSRVDAPTRARGVSTSARSGRANPCSRRGVSGSTRPGGIDPCARDGGVDVPTRTGGIDACAWDGGVDSSTKHGRVDV
jgi:hypothetical protein